VVVPMTEPVRKELQVQVATLPVLPVSPHRSPLAA
jgi:hypothetical protein